MNRSGPKVLVLYGDMNGCTWWRAVRPAEALNKAGSYVALAHKDEPGVENVAHLYDAVVLPRMSWEDHRTGERFVSALHRAGLTVIYECDDDLFSPAVNSRINLLDREASLEKLEERRLDRLEALKLCDGITVSSPRLATVMRTLVDYPVHVVPNALDVDWFQSKLEPRTIPEVTIGWTGGTRPDTDLLAMAEAWGIIAKRHPNVTFIVYGWIPQFLEKRGVPLDRVVAIPWREVDTYPGPFSNIDIGCAAVSNEPFNRSKTPIKAWEYAAGGAAVVATETLYGSDIRDGLTGYIAETTQEWVYALDDLVLNAPRRKRMARALMQRVQREHSLRENLWRWPAAWSSIIETFRASHRVGPQILLAR